ncbi:hypothetical protein DB31_6090 [Hyalangium minutum]|uniref:Uncharacterized protein n=1 Tax=Hyalangium minutum TaxID=394096 RepID=A0A085VWK4_9BACT|nr:hypothetical protein DB31_6090 [Hyalangium minutum]
MAELKTKKTVANVEDFLAGITPEKKRQDASPHPGFLKA